MQLLTVETASGEVTPGVLSTVDGAVIGLASYGFATLLELIQAGPGAWAEVAALTSRGGEYALHEVRVLAPIPRPERNLFCVGANYQMHWDEGDRAPGAGAPTNPVFFTKPWTTVCGDGDSVWLDPRVSTKVDWEAEIAVVIGTEGINIPASEAMGHVFGYTLANDVSARDLQLEYTTTGQWFKGKSLDRFCPMGPAITTADACRPEEIDVELDVNGEPKQRFSGAQMIHSVARIIERLSLGMRLLPGDIILTGTGSGVGLWQKPQQFLVPGDRVEMRSSVLGELRFVTAAAPVGEER